MDTILTGLNAPQREAVTHGEGPLLVLAGAGSGKTRVITRRIAWLIEAGGVPEWGILAITFTNKAAREMRERVEELLPGRRIWVATFHSSCARILRREGERLGYTADFSILDTYDRSQLLKGILKDLDLDPKTFVPAALGNQISRRKNCGEGPRPEEERALMGYLERVHDEIFEEYERRRRIQNAMDFDDLLLEAVRLLEGDEEVRASYAGRFQHVLVDEYQDTNSIQLRLLRSLCSLHRNICVVGDPDQSIYSWRGADVRNILEFERDFSGAHTIRLEQNYRSSGNVLRAASELISRNEARYEKSLWTEAADGEPVRVLTSPTDAEEAWQVVQLVRQLVLDGVTPSGIAVFYRVNAMQRILEKALREGAIPYQVVGGLEFFQRKEIKDLLAYLWVLLNPSADTALLRIIGVPPRGIGAKTIEHLRRAALERGCCISAMLGEAAAIPGLRAAAHRRLEAFDRLLADLRAISEGPAAQVLGEVLEQVDYIDYITGLGDQAESDREENVLELAAYAEEFDRRESSGLRGFLQEVALLSDVDRWEGGIEKIALMTLHAAKGLEFDGVLIIGCEEGVLPHQRSFEAPAALEEERRLLHVGMTRARTHLFLSHARSRLRYGGYQEAPPSRFLSEFGHRCGLGDEGDDVAGGLGGDASERWDFEPVEAPAECEWAVDEVVMHDHFGRGRIQEFRGRHPNTRVIVAFEEAGEKQLLLQYAGLKRPEAAR